MNSVSIVGRLTADPMVRYTSGDSPTAVARFTVACDRRFKRENEPEADFISCIAFGKTAEFLERYFTKGMKIGINGRIQTGNYVNKDGVKVYTTDVVCEGVEFTERKADSAQNAPAPEQNQSGDGFMNIPDGIDEELPFN